MIVPFRLTCTTSTPWTTFVHSSWRRVRVHTLGVHVLYMHGCCVGSFNGEPMVELGRSVGSMWKCVCRQLYGVCGYLFSLLWLFPPGFEISGRNFFQEGRI